MVSTWIGDHSSVEVDAVVKNTVKSQKWRNGASKSNMYFLGKKRMERYKNVGFFKKTYSNKKSYTYTSTVFAWM